MLRHKNLTAAAVAALAIVAIEKPASAWTGFYVGLGGGPDFMPDRSLEIDDTFGGNTSRIPTNSKWETGWALTIVGGYKWDFGLRAEAEYSYREQKIKAFDATPWYGSQWDNSLMVNLFYDIPTGTNFTPYIGGGIGGTHLSWGDNFRPANTIVIYDASELKFGWQGIVGVAYTITPRIDLTLDYRVKGSEGYSFPANIPGIVANNFDYLTQTVVFGFRYSIGD